MRAGVKISAKAIQLFENALAVGATIERAAQLALISEPYVYVMHREGSKLIEAAAAKGAKPDESNQFVKFTRAMDRGLEKWANDELANIRIQAEHDWRASAWLLERRMRDRFGVHTAVDVKTQTAPPDGIDYSRLSDADLATLDGILEKAKTPED